MEGAHAIVRDGGRWLGASAPVDAVIADGTSAFAALDRIASGGFWVGFCAFDLGRAIERVAVRCADDLHLPDLAFVRFDRV